MLQPYLPFLFPHWDNFLGGIVSIFFPSDAQGQLGLGSPSTAVVSPRAVVDLQEIGPVVDIACGRR